MKKILFAILVFLIGYVLGRYVWPTKPEPMVFPCRGVQMEIEGYRIPEDMPAPPEVQGPGILLYCPASIIEKAKEWNIQQI